jgi:ferrous iron transport protein B
MSTITRSRSETSNVSPVLLVGHPNVGKSALFNRLTGGENIKSNYSSNSRAPQGFWIELTGANVTESNYPGTTVDFTTGELTYKGESMDVIDVPGTFSLDPKNTAEEVAADILEEHSDATVVCVVDATRYERGLNLVLEVIEQGYTVVLAVNMWDEAREQNIDIDIDRLETILDVPVTPTVATSGEGIKQLVESFERARSSSVPAIRERLAADGDEKI